MCVFVAVGGNVLMHALLPYVHSLILPVRKGYADTIVHLSL
jgi:hypothetical protein